MCIYHSHVLVTNVQLLKQLSYSEINNLFGIIMVGWFLSQVSQHASVYQGQLLPYMLSYSITQQIKQINILQHKSQALVIPFCFYGMEIHRAVQYD